MNICKQRLRIAISVLLLSTLVSGCSALNNRVIQDLQNNPEGKRAEEVLLLTLPDGQRLPVNYITCGQWAFIGADGRWWRQLREPVKVTALIKGVELQGVGQAIRDDAAKRKRVFKELRPLWPTWLPQSLGGVLVQLQLAATTESNCPLL